MSVSLAKECNLSLIYFNAKYCREKSLLSRNLKWLITGKSKPFDDEPFLAEAVSEEKIHKLPPDKQNLLDDFYNILVKYNADSTEL
ncbi:MAG: hypothetical protein K8S87_11940 [Planctomycetes bacterium]|nr:hypothetical protein [Planctomycetota bacterium]